MEESKKFQPSETLLSLPPKLATPHPKIAGWDADSTWPASPLVEGWVRGISEVIAESRTHASENPQG